MTFRIRKTFLLPLGLVVLEIIALLVSCIVFKQPLGKSIILGVMVLPVVVLFIECLFRHTTINDNAVITRKFLRSKKIELAKISSIETIQIKKRAFVTICTTDDDFLIFSNAYSGFPTMITTLLSSVPEEVISEETAAMANEPPQKTSDVITCWLAAALMGFILYSQLKMFL